MNLLEHPSVMSESEFSGLVRDVARLGGWTLRYHPFFSRKSRHGWPDWTFVHPRPALLFAELKTERGRVSPEQQQWIDALGALEAPTGGLVRARIWRPSDWDEIVEVLTGRRVVRAA